MPALPVGLTSEESWRSSGGVKIHVSRQYEVPPWGVRPRGNQEACLLGQFPGCVLLLGVPYGPLPPDLQAVHIH